MRQRIIAGALALAIAGPLAAEEWQALDDAGVREALSDRSLTYENGARQSFRASGMTSYSVGNGDSQGRWRAEGGRYCSVWPPSEAWSCYRLERAADGGRLRFFGASGDITVGTYDSE